MKITPKYNIGDTVMCKAVKDQYDKDYKNILGIITDVKIYMQGSDVMITYSVHWADRDDSSLTDEKTVGLLREHYLKTRHEMGV
jgi:hypothetical protein